MGLSVQSAPEIPFRFSGDTLHDLDESLVCRSSSAAHAVLDQNARVTLGIQLWPQPIPARAQSWLAVNI